MVDRDGVSKMEVKTVVDVVLSHVDHLLTRSLGFIKLSSQNIQKA